MVDVLRLTPEDVKPRVDAGDAFLVCAYDDSEKFSTYRLEGAIALSEFREKEAGLSQDKEVIFYCA